LKRADGGALGTDDNDFVIHFKTPLQCSLKTNSIKPAPLTGKAIHDR
jgi:hypothetical protein